MANASDDASDNVTLSLSEFLEVSSDFEEAMNWEELHWKQVGTSLSSDHGDKKSDSEGLGKKKRRSRVVLFKVPVFPCVVLFVIFEPFVGDQNDAEE